MKPTTETFEKWNEEHAEKHDLDKFYNHPNSIFRYIENKRVNVLIEAAEIISTDNVLEVGCGAGHILDRIKTGNIYGCDISSVQVERTQKRLGDRAKIIKSPGENMPYENNFFDKILCSEVIEHVLDPLPLLKEISRVLKNDGILSLSIPNENLINVTKKTLHTLRLERLIAPKKSGWDLASKNNLDEWHLHEFNLEMINKYSENIFSIKKIYKIPNLFIPFRYVLKMKKVNG